MKHEEPQLKVCRTVVSGLNIEYLVGGRGTPLLFLHGDSIRARTVLPLLRLLASHYTVYAPDIPGFGGSESPKEIWSYADYASFFSVFINHIKLRDVTVVGYSMGGAVACHLAAEDKRVRDLVLIDSSGIRPDKKGGYKNFRRLFFYTTHPQYYTTFVTLMRDSSQYFWRYRSNHARIKKMHEAFYVAPYDEVLRKISVPTRVIWGTGDRNIPLARGKRFLDYIPQATLETLPGTHDWPVYNPSLIHETTILHRRI